MNLSRRIGSRARKIDPGGVVKCVIRVRARGWSAPVDENGEYWVGKEVEGLPTEWNHNLLTGGWKRGAQVRCEVKAVTTRSPLLRREMIIHPLAHRTPSPP